MFSKISNRTSHSPSSANNSSIPFFQPKLNVGKAGDRYEVEADRTANQILACDNDKLNQPTFFAPTTTVSKKPSEEKLEEKEPEKIQEKPLAEAITPLVQKEEKEEEIQTELTDEQDQVQKQAEKDTQQAEIVESQVQKKTLPTITNTEIQNKEEEIQEKKEHEEEEPIQVKSFVQKNEETIPEKEEESQMVQAKSDENPVASSSVESQLNSSKGNGSPLPEDTRSEMESGFGTDFGNVRVHTDSAAVQMSKGLGAQAFTHGSDIYFNEGKYNPASNSGKHLLAHELTHTVQQGASIQKKMIQKEEGDEELTTPTNEYTYTDPANREEYSINTVSNTASLPTVGVPRFKVPFGPAVRFQLPVGGPTRENTHIQVWETAAMSGEGFTSEFNQKIQQETPPAMSVGNAPVYYLVLKGGTPRQTRGTSEGDAGVILGSPEEVKRRISRPYWNESGQYIPHDVDHKMELQLGGNETDLSNLWILEASANRSSGSLISAEINRRIRTLINGSRDHLLTQPNFDTVKDSYSITVENGVSAGRDMRLGEGANPNQYWTLDQVQSGRHLRGLKFLSEAEIEAAGLRGSPNELVFYTNSLGGRPIRIPWDENARSAGRKDGLESLNIWIGRRGGASLRIDSVVYNSNTGGEGQGGNGAIICTAFPGDEGIIREKRDLALATAPMQGVSYGGYITRPSVLQAVLHAMELRQLSPITLNQAELNDNGLVGSGSVAPTFPLINRAGIDLVIDEDGIRVRKLFSSSDFDFPSPFEIQQTSLELFISSSRGLGIEGQVDFGINNVGEGHIGAAASTSGGFELEGAFNFDSELFDPAEINVEYKDNIWTIGGQIGIPGGKVRGVKNATITATYSENSFAATGEAELDVPGIERGTMAVNYGPEGFSIAGNFNLSDDIPGIRGGSVEARVSKAEGAENYDIFVSGTAQPAIPGIDSTLTVTYENGALTIEGSAAYNRGMLSGTVNIGATNRAIGDDGQPSGEPDDTMRVYGGGSLTLTLTPWLQATAGVNFLPNGEIEVTGRIALPGTVDVFDRRSIDRNLFNIPAIEIPIFAIPLGPRSIGLVARITGGLDFSAGFGPGQIRELSAEVTYNPDHEDQTTITGRGLFAIPADAGLTLRGDLGLGVSIGIASLSGGIEIAGTLGLQGEAAASVDVNWSPQTGLAIDATGSITVNPKFTFDINAFARASLDLWVTSISETWRYNLASFSWGPDIQFGITFPVHYREGETFDMSFDDIQVTYPDLDIVDMAIGLARDIKDNIFD